MIAEAVKEDIWNTLIWASDPLFMKRLDLQHWLLLTNEFEEMLSYRGLKGGI